MHSLFGALPDFFSDEAELRTIWSDPDTRKALLLGLADKGFSKAPLLKLRYRNAMADALSDLGSAAQIRQVFVGFQQYLYQG